MRCPYSGVVTPVLYKLALLLWIFPEHLTNPENGKGVWLVTLSSIGTYQVHCHLWVIGSISTPDRLIYNKTSRTTQFPHGVDVHVPGFGETFSVEYLDPSISSIGM